MSAVPGPVYGLEIPPGEILIPAAMEFPASFRITMAAVDPTEDPEADDEGNIPAVPRSTLRLVKRAFPGLDDEDDEVDDEYMKALLAADSGSDEDDEEEEANGGPSDPAKAKKQKQLAAIKKLMEATEGDSDDEMEDAKPNGVKSKGKAKATEEESEDDEEEEEDSDDESDEGADLENFVICTLDTERNYQQPLDITVNHGEKVFFVVSGTHTVYLTGNYIMDDDEDDEDDDEDEYDLSPDELDYALGEDMSDEESDELDDVENPRVTEVDSEEEAPKLVTVKKGKNKRTAEDAAEGLDELIAKADDTKLSKKQQKKLKNNKGEAVTAEDNKKDAKKVQFAKNLEQGPTGSTEKAKQNGKAAGGVKVVQGVTVDDRTLGNGRTVKNGDTVGVRYIGKLANGQQFDANKKGKPFSFKVGKGQVIKGWDVGIVGMAIGGERRMTIPAHLAYGSRGMPGIPANSQLTFDVKLLEIK
ncbi:Fc.00g063610.m01.CDS01 [Cosmosporella sp. VM-42]